MLPELQMQGQGQRRVEPGKQLQPSRLEPQVMQPRKLSRQLEQPPWAWSQQQQQKKKKQVVSNAASWQQHLPLQ